MGCDRGSAPAVPTAEGVGRRAHGSRRGAAQRQSAASAHCGCCRRPRVLRVALRVWMQAGKIVRRCVDERPSSSGSSGSDHSGKEKRSRSQKRARQCRRTDGSHHACERLAFRRATQRILAGSFLIRCGDLLCMFMCMFTAPPQSTAGGAPPLSSVRRLAGLDAALCG